MVNEPVGARVKDVMVKKDGAYAPLDPAKKYKLVVNNFMGTGGDKNFTLGKIPATAGSVRAIVRDARVRPQPSR